MKIGLALSVQHLPTEPQAVRFREHVEQVRVARAIGFDSVWASQHYLSAPFTYFQPIPTLARVAAEAEGMRLGTGCLLLPLHHPVEVADSSRSFARRGRAWAGRPLPRCRSSGSATWRPPGRRRWRRPGYRSWEQDRALPPGEEFATDFAALARDRFLIGATAAVADEIARYRERLGVTTLVLRMQWPGLEQARVIRALEALGERLVSRLP